MPHGPKDESGVKPETDASGGYFRRLKDRLSKTRKSLSEGFERVFVGKKKIDDDLLEELEELLITSDIGVQTTLALMEKVSAAKITEVDQVKALLKAAKRCIGCSGSSNPDDPDEKSTI